MFEKVKDAGGREDANEGKQICRGQHATAMLFLRPMLHQRTDRHDEKATKKSQQRKQNQSSRKDDREQRAKNQT